MHRRTLLQGAAASLLAAPAIAQPAKAATLRFVPQANLTLLDPIFTTATVTNNHAYYVFDTLYSCGPDGRPKPQMAEGHQISDDGRTWRIRLRDGLKFHDGTPVLARDCAASIERWTKREPFGQTLAKVVEKFGTADDRTIEIRLSRPFPLLTAAIGKPDASLPFMMPERLARTDANTQVTEMVGSGPYRFIASEYNTGSHVAYRSLPIMSRAANLRSGAPAARWRISPVSSGRSSPMPRHPALLCRTMKSTGGSSHCRICCRRSPRIATSRFRWTIRRGANP